MHYENFSNFYVNDYAGRFYMKKKVPFYARQVTQHTGVIGQTIIDNNFYKRETV